MNNRRTLLLPKIILGQVLVGAIMASLGFSVLFFAEGYRINFKKLSVYKTGMISISINPREAQIYLDSNLVKMGSVYDRSAYRVNLRPGYYNVTIVKDGYVTWEKTIRVESEKVVNYSSVVLFKEKIVVDKLTDNKKIDLLLSPSDIVAFNKNGNALSSNGNEIWFNNNLVTRFSTQVLGVSWYPDKQHFLVQLSNEIRVIDVDGTNNILLATLKESLPAQFTTNIDGNELYYRDGSDYMLAHIR